MSTITETQTSLPAGTWQVDPVHSHVGFAVKYNGGTFRGSFSGIDARLEVAPDGAASLTGGARVENVKVQDENLSAHLLSPEFFDSERTPEIRFASQRASRSGDSLTVAGELTIKGRTQPVELRGSAADPITDGFGNERVHLTLEGVVDRTQFGLDWNMPLPSGEPALANDVKLTAELYFVKA
jgi:polyisoprenoid-binding protein YceI